MDSSKLREVWARFPTGVTLISTLDAYGKAHSMTANAVCSVSLDPPLALVCVAHARQSHSYIKEKGGFSISILNREQESLAHYFSQDPALRVGEADPEYVFDSHGIPILKKCHAYLVCYTEAHYDAGTHTIFIGRITEAAASKDIEGPLVFYQSGYTSLQNFR